MRGAVLLLALLGTLLFGGAFVVSYSNPLLVERAAREVLRIEVERRVGARIDALSDSRIGGFARKALAATGRDVERAEREWRQGVPPQVAEIVGYMLRADCACRLNLDAMAESAAQERISSLRDMQARLSRLIESAYASVRRNLLREFRIFTASNAVAFLLLGVVALARRKANLQLALPALVVVGAVAITGGLYLFNQDWLHTIVFGEYLGLGYALYLAVVVGLLADIAFNRARISTEVVNAALQLAGSPLSAVPC